MKRDKPTDPDRCKQKKFKGKKEILDSLDAFFDLNERREVVDRFGLTNNKAIWSGKEHTDNLNKM